MAVRVRAGIWVAVGVSAGVTGVEIDVAGGGAAVAGLSVCCPTATAAWLGVGAPALAAGRASWASAIVRAVTRSIRPASDSPTMIKITHRIVVEER
jgi:hypothetical protein